MSENAPVWPSKVPPGTPRWEYPHRVQVPGPDDDEPVEDGPWCADDGEDWSDRNGEPSESQLGCIMLAALLLGAGLMTAAVIIVGEILGAQ